MISEQTQAYFQNKKHVITKQKHAISKQKHVISKQEHVIPNSKDSSSKQKHETSEQKHVSLHVIWSNVVKSGQVWSIVALLFLNVEQT